MNARMKTAMWVAIGLLSIGEAAIAGWFTMLAGGPRLSPTQYLMVVAALGALNAAVFPGIRERVRAGGRREQWTRIWIMASIAALATGVAVAALYSTLVVGFSAAGWAFDPQGRLLFLAVGSAIVAVGFGAVAWGATVGDRRVRIDRVSLPLRHAHASHEALRIAHLTDLHIGPLLRPERLRAFVDRTNELEADLIAITGDIFDFDPAYVDDGCRELERLNARLGTWAVLGNHDVATGTEAVVRGLSSHTKVQLLRDSWERIDVDGAPLVLAGIEDPGEGWAERQCRSDALERLAREIPQDLPCVLLAHRPSYFAHAAQLGFSVILSGHTHGGQIAAPLAQNYNPSRVIADHTRGVFRSEDSTLYVNRGLGMAGLALRINCPREIALIDFVATARPA